MLIARDFRDWRPATSSRLVRRRPVRLLLEGRDLVLFRTRRGQVGVVPGRCLHRGMPLSEGRVVGDGLECAYHGWSYSVDGRVCAPGRAETCEPSASYDVQERHGVVWLRDAGPGAPLPPLAPEGFQHVRTIHGVVAAPVELLLVNFTEIEHTALVHWLFGYPLDRLAEVTFRSAVEDGKVFSESAGPQKPLPPGAGSLLGIRTGDRLVMEWVAAGPPLHVRYQIGWEDPRSGARRPLRLFEVAYFASLGPRQSAVTALYFVDLRSRVPGLVALGKAIVGMVIALEYRRDSRLLARLGSLDPSLRSCRLGRFDASLVAQRKLFFTDSDRAP
jgi:vanillate O-demethylase monooxygenase subunit